MRPLLNPNSAPPSNEYGKKRSTCAKLGISQAQFEAMYGKPGNRKQRGKGAANAAEWAKTLPKGNTP